MYPQILRGQGSLRHPGPPKRRCLHEILKSLSSFFPSQFKFSPQEPETNIPIWQSRFYRLSRLTLASAICSSGCATQTVRDRLLMRWILYLDDH